MSSNEDIFVLKDTGKPNPKPFVAYITSLFYFAVVLCLGLGIFFTVRGNKTAYISFYLIGVLITGVLIFFNYYYEWFLNVKVRFSSKEIIYTFDEIISVLGHTEVKDKISKVTRIVVKSNKIIVYGDILHYEPAQKPKSRTKVELPTGFENQKDLIKKLHEFKEKTENE